MAECLPEPLRAALEAIRADAEPASLLPLLNAARAQLEEYIFRCPLPPRPQGVGATCRHWSACRRRLTPVLPRLDVYGWLVLPVCCCVVYNNNRAHPWTSRRDSAR
jgi:hypothetical protein